MPLEIDIDPHGYRRVPFVELRTRLLALDKPFTERELRLLPYTELVNAAIANAGKAACPLHLVLREKERRRYRFMNMSPDEFSKAKRYLQIEGMYSDVRVCLKMRYAPHWDDLSPRVHLWCKLNCLYNHCGAPDARIREAHTMVGRASLGAGLVEKMTADLDRLRWLFTGANEEDEFRHISGSMADSLLTQMDSDERLICERELVIGYSCTGDCYRALGDID
jgi:hypothetical protein